MDHTAILPEILFPLVGTIIAQSIWLAPWKAVQTATRNGELGEINPMPWALMLGNTISCAYESCSVTMGHS